MVAEKLEQNLRNHLANTRVNLFSDKAGVVGYQRPGNAALRLQHMPRAHDADQPVRAVLHPRHACSAHPAGPCRRPCQRTAAPMDVPSTGARPPGLAHESDQHRGWGAAHHAASPARPFAVLTARNGGPQAADSGSGAASASAPKRKEYDLDAKDAFWRSNVGTIFPEVARTCVLPVLDPCPPVLMSPHVCPGLQSMSRSSWPSTRRSTTA